MTEKGTFGRIIIDNFLVGIIFAVLYLFLIMAAFMAALGNPTDSARIILEIFVIASPTENIANNLVIWFSTGIIISLILKKTRKPLP